MKKIVSIIIISFLFSALAVADNHDKEKKKDVLSGNINGLKIENLLVEKLNITDSLEIVISYLDVPPNTMLPMHWHHGEEFIYVIKGSAIIILKDKPDTKIEAGDVFKIPLKHIHTAKTTDDSCTVVVFRVHEEGKPTRVLVDETN